MTDGPDLGRPVPGWTPPPVPARAPVIGRYMRLDPLSAPDHAADLHVANIADTAGAIWAYLPYGPFDDLPAYAEWVAKVAAAPDPMFFAITDLDTGWVGGVLSLMRINPNAGSIEVGHLNFAPALQRTRAASETVLALAALVFDLGYRRFEWKCNALNRRSRRSAERFGFSFEGVFRNASVIKGRNRDTAWFAMTDDDWPALRRAHGAWLDPANFDADRKQRAPLAELTAPSLVCRDPVLARAEAGDRPGARASGA